MLLTVLFLCSLLVLSGFLTYKIVKLQRRISMLERMAISTSQVLNDLATACKYNSEAGRSLTGIVELLQKDNTEFQQEMAQFVVEVARFIESNVSTGDAGSRKKDPLN